MLKGMVVRLRMGSNGTDDHVFIGVVGTGGGREFPLNVSNFDDFEARSDVTYVLGEVWDGNAISDPEIHHPNDSHDMRSNDPAFYLIDFEQISHVYIRKAGTRKDDDDDTGIVRDVEVTLYEERPLRRFFANPFDSRRGARSPVILANNRGLQYWLVEEQIEEDSTSNITSGPDGSKY